MVNNSIVSLMMTGDVKPPRPTKQIFLLNYTIVSGVNETGVREEEILRQRH